MQLHFRTSDKNSRESSRREVLILGPSLGTTSRLWDQARQSLDDDFHVYAWDLPGHGGSPVAGGAISMTMLAQSVLEIADAEGITKFHYAGESIGGAVGLELARFAPERLSSLTVVCSAAKIGESGAWIDRAKLVESTGLGAIIEATPSRWFSPLFINDRPEVVASMLAELETTDSRSYARLCEALSSFDAREWLRGIDVPTLALAAENDVVTPVEQASYIAGTVLRGKLEVVPDAAHQAVVEQPERVATLITEFIRNIHD
ncbi:MAG: hypothetical protein RLZZ600_976 [Actinomycetota bacterium]|jgi:3-oxoadipate enol-lactonase